MRQYLKACAAAAVLFSAAGVMAQPAPPGNAAPPAKEISPAAEKALADLAAKTALPAGTRIVLLGDSITAPGSSLKYKYPEMIRDALAPKYGDKVEVVNAGKGGDNVLSAGKRVEADVIALKPTIVFINLGVNDSKLTAPDHTKNQVPIEKFTDGYRSLIKTIQEKTGAKVVIVGTIACVDEWTKNRAMGKEKKATYFGNPEELKKYNAVAQELAKEFKLDYLDLFDLFMAQPDLKALFKKDDGVHTVTPGQELISQQIMGYLQKTYPAK